MTWRNLWTWGCVSCFTATRLLVRKSTQTSSLICFCENQREWWAVYQITKDKLLSETSAFLKVSPLRAAAFQEQMVETVSLIWPDGLLCLTEAGGVPGRVRLHPQHQRYETDQDSAQHSVQPCRYRRSCDVTAKKKRYFIPQMHVPDKLHLKDKYRIRFYFLQTHFLTLYA